MDLPAAMRRFSRVPLSSSMRIPWGMVTSRFWRWRSPQNPLVSSTVPGLIGWTASSCLDTGMTGPPFTAAALTAPPVVKALPAVPGD